MTDCKNIREQLSAFIDGELSGDQDADVRQHLDQCSECRNDWQQLSHLDELLENRLTIDRLVQRNVDAIRKREEARRTYANRPFASMQRSSWWVGLLAVAAAVALYVGLRLSDSQSRENRHSVAATLVSATGPIEVLEPGERRWKTIEAAGGSKVKKGTRVRTKGKSLCELWTSSNAKVRLNQGCEIIVDHDNQLDLVQGQIWCCASKDQFVELKVPIGQPDKKREVARFMCPQDASVQCDLAFDGSLDTTVTKSDSNVRAEVKMGRQTWQVSPGETLTFDHARQVKRSKGVTGQDAWQLPLLALRESTRSELKDHMRRLLAPIGMTKAKHMNEVQIQALGPAGAIPLLSYVAQETDEEQRRLRRTAMRLAMLSADESSLGLIECLTSDQDEVIAQWATEAMQRLDNRER